MEVSLKDSIGREIPIEPLVPDRHRYVVYYAPGAAPLAKRILESTGYSELFKSGEIINATFPDGWPNITINDINKIRERHVVFIGSIFTPTDLFPQLAILYSLPRFDIKSLTVILPYFATGTMERVDKEGQVATAMTLARLISVIPLSAGGPTKVVIFDIHALQERFYFGDSVIPVLESGIPLVIKTLKAQQAANNICIAFPDDGAQKRFGLAFRDFDQLICAKVRQGDKRIVTLKEGDPKGRHVVMIDDLVQSGGTLIETAKVLLANGAADVSAYVTHAIFPNETWKKFTENPEVNFKKFWITDSCPTAEKLIGVSPFEVISLAPQICDYLFAYTKLSIK